MPSKSERIRLLTVVERKAHLSQAGDMNKSEFYAALAGRFQSFSPVPLDELTPEDKLFTSGLIDSLNIVELIEFIEQFCAIKVNPTEFSMDNFDSMASIASYVERKLSSKD